VNQYPTREQFVPLRQFVLYRSKPDDESNQVTTSMLRNAAKANFTLDELGWSLCPRGDRTKWDGLMGWFVAQVRADPALRADGYLRQWFAAAETAQCGMPLTRRRG
jgi:hypothetical protein